MHFNRSRRYQIMNRPNIIALQNTLEADAISKTTLGDAHETCLHVHMQVIKYLQAQDETHRFNSSD